MVSTSNSPVVSGHKTFDRQAAGDFITTGNVWGSVQFSNFIRGYHETSCNGVEFEKGVLQKYDLASYPNLPRDVKTVVINASNELGSVILYEYRHWYKRKKIVHGYVITTTDQILVETFYNNHVKSGDIIQSVLPYITREEEVEEHYVH